YVAMTRAVHALELLLPAEPEKKSSRSTGPALTHAALVEPAFEGEPERGALAAADETTARAEERATLVWEHTDSTAAWSTAEESDVPYVPEPAFELLPAESPPLPAIAPSQVGRRGRESGARAYEATETRGRAQRIGDLVHAALAEIEWAGPDGSFDEAAVALACARLEHGRDSGPLVQDAHARVAAAFRTPAFAALFHEPSGEARVLAERAFDVEVTDLDDAPRRVKGAFDRLVLRTDGGAVTSVTLVEFKTGAAATLDEVVEAARDQVALYRASLAALFGLEEARIDARIAWLPERGAAAVARFE
ncbi:MAG: PD-(D/E)XK nuclease family protein, partial [Planctomycetota bacterium]